MNHLQDIMLEDFGWQVLRTPLYPATLANQGNFFELLNNNVFQEAIYLSSRSLYRSLMKLLAHTLSEKEKKRVTQSLFSYFLRASYRCTPFGLMAGLALGNISDQTQVLLQGIERHNKIDAEALYLLRHSPLVSQEKLYHPNPTLYQYDSNSQRYFYREVQHHSQQGYNYQFQYSSVEVNEYLELLCRDASARSKETYIQQLIAEEVDSASASEFVQDLIDAQLLQESFQISPVGAALQERMLLSNGGKAFVNKTKRTAQIADYQAIEKMIMTRGLGQIPKAEKHIRHFFHVDTERKVQGNTLNKTQVNKITQVIKTLYKVIPARFNHSLQEFCKAFNQRYQGQQISLLELIDPENGILYPSGNALKQPHIFNQLAFPKTPKPATVTLDRWQTFLLKTYSESVLEEKIIKLSSKKLLADLGNTNAEALHYPETVGALVSVLGPDKIQLKNTHFGAGTYLGRFGLMNLPLERAIQQITDYEQSTNPEVMYAEIVHAPAHPKTYNILNRSGNIRRYKLVLFANPNLYPPEEVILPQDLSVSVFKDEVVIHHIPTGKRVLPFLTTAHNQRGSNFPIYNFLCDLTYQGTYVANWSWGVLAQSGFLPRVEIDGVVVAPATWKIKQMKALETLDIPDKFWLTLADRKLMIDKNCALSKKILQDKLGSGNQEVTIEEYLFEDYVVQDAQGQGYTNEMVIPLKVTNPRKLKVNFRHQAPFKHFLGDSWVYFKIYCGAFTADALLKNQILQIIVSLNANIDKWFFIRYNDQQGPHLRIRLKCHRFTSEIFTSINTALEYYLQKGLINICFDTYEPEVLRYGGAETLDVCESIFCEDSKTIIQALQLLEQNKGEKEEQYIIGVAMKNIAYLLEDFGFSLEQRVELTHQVAYSFSQEFKANTPFKKKLNKTYRDYQQKIVDIDPVYDKLFRARSTNLQPLIAQINTLTLEKKNAVTLPQLVNSLAHMSLNRLFNQLSRQQEYITWDFLGQKYKTEMYKRKRQGK